MRGLFRVMLLFLVAGAIGSVEAKRIPMDRVAKGHPRLLVGKEGFEPLKRNAKNPAGRELAGRIIYDADQILELPLLEPQRAIDGVRLQDTGQIALYRITTLCVAEKLTGESKYARRAIAEMVKVAGYSDWNPRHYLDTSEITLAIALGCDWLYDAMTPEEREQVQRAIIEKGIKPSYIGNQGWWVKLTNNWNQVCHAGMVAGALCVVELDPELTEKTLERAVKNLPLAMKPSYFPNGTYPEGPMYWLYATDFNCVLLGMLNAAFGEDFGLSSQPGFSKTGDFIRAATCPTGRWFNYSDCWPGSQEACFSMIYLANRFNRPDWFDEIERKRLSDYAKARPKGRKFYNRLLPLALLYLKEFGESRNAPLSYYSGDEALVPISVMRSDLTEDAAWVGLKGGSPSASHGHMDGGSFVFESGGCRWADDLGMELYGKIELSSFELWNIRPESDRWKILRIGPDSHNILRISGAPQNVNGRARFTKCSGNSAEMDLTTLYAPAARQVIRHASLLSGRGLEIRDRLSGLVPDVTVSWQMCTRADLEKLPDGSLRLRQGEKSLILKKNIPGTWRIYPDEELRRPFEAPNPHMKMIRFDARTPKDGKLELVVNLLPE